MSESIVSELRCSEEGEAWRLSASVTLGGKRHDIWYRVSAGPIADGPNSLFAAALIPAMRFGTPLRIEGTVSSRLLKQAETIQDIIHVWYRDFQKIAVVSHGTTAGNGHSTTAKGVGCFFSGGVDSFYSVLKHRDEITHLIFVHGFDLKLEDEPLRDRIAEKIRQVAKELGKPLLEVETNLRTFSDQYTDWGQHYYGSALASVALLLSPLLQKVYIASDDTYAYLEPWGSGPLLTPLWSTESVEISLDGCEASRVEKVAKIVASETVLKSLRVCWKNLEGAYNCGRCEKCLRTMVSLRAVKALERCQTFDRPLDLSLVAWLDTSDEKTTRVYTQESFEFVKRNGNDPELCEALHDALTRLHYRGVSGWPRRAFKRLRRVLT